MLTWWAFQQNGQVLLSLDNSYQIEHIIARNRLNRGNEEISADDVEELGNKVLLETRINIRASDYRFSDKKRYYLGTANARKVAARPSEIIELARLSEKADFTVVDVRQRTTQIIHSFIQYLHDLNLIKEE